MQNRADLPGSKYIFQQAKGTDWSGKNYRGEV